MKDAFAWLKVFVGMKKKQLSSVSVPLEGNNKLSLQSYSALDPLKLALYVCDAYCVASSTACNPVASSYLGQFL